MTTEEPSHETPTDDAVHDEADWFLRELVNWANRYDFSVYVTLNVGGVTISGTLIGGKEYFSKLSQQFGYTDEDNEIAKCGDAYGPDVPVAPVAYIHLKGARIVGGTGHMFPGNAPLLWRGRLGEVDGFAIGSLSSPE